MLKITMITLGKLKEKYLREAAAEYIKRLSSLCALNIIEIEPVRLRDHPSQREIDTALQTEGEKITAKIPGGAAIFPLCIEGKQCGSEELSGKLQNAAMNSGNAVFIIGSSYGLSNTIKSLGAPLSMSSMTFPHQLARIMLLEQIYRAMKISEGGIYHK